MRRSILAIFLVMIFLASSITISNDVETNTKNEKVVASITYSSNEHSSTTFALQPIVVITQPEDGAVVTDPHLVVLGYASDESGMNYWEWEWRWAGGSKSNSSYFETAEYVEFRIDIYGLHSGWNLIIVRFKNIYGALGEDSVNVTYNPPNSPPNKPTKPEGPTEGKVKETLHFNTVTTDPDGDSLEYLIDWGDGTNTGWLGPITSGTPFQNFHAWDEPGTYEVKAKARDIPYLEESEWSEPLVVTISSEDDELPVVVIEYPEDGATFTEPDIHVTGTATDNVGVIQIGYIQEWEGGGMEDSWPIDSTTYYPFDIEITLHEGLNTITITASDEAGNEPEHPPIRHVFYKPKEGLLIDAVFQPVQVVYPDDPKYGNDMSGGPCVWNAGLNMVAGKNTYIFGYPYNDRNTIRITVHNNYSVDKTFSFVFRIYPDDKIIWRSDPVTIPAKTKRIYAYQAPLPDTPFQWERWGDNPKQKDGEVVLYLDPDPPVKSPADCNCQVVTVKVKVKHTHDLDVLFLPFTFGDGPDFPNDMASYPSNFDKWRWFKLEPWWQAIYPVREGGLDTIRSHDKIRQNITVDGVTVSNLSTFRNLNGNQVYKLWNRLFSNAVALSWMKLCDRIVWLLHPEVLRHPTGGIANGWAYQCPPGAIKQGVLVNWNIRSKTPAHEISHTYGLDDCYNPGQKSNAVGYWVNEKKDIVNKKDLMWFTNSISNSWIKKPNFKSLLKRFNEQRDPEVLGISGIIDKNDNIELNPWYKLENGYVDLEWGTTGEYSIKAYNGDGVLLDEAGFNISFTTFMDPGGEILVNETVFAFRVEWIDGLHRIDIINATSGEILATRTVSPNSPQVSILTPYSGENVQPGLYNITWNAYDTDGDQMTFYVFMRNGSSGWFPISLSTQKNYFVADFSQHKEGDYQIEVVATDGVNTGTGISETFTILPDTISPIVSIEKPGRALYIFDREIMPFLFPISIGKITIEANASDNIGVSNISFYIDDEMKNVSFESPYSWLWNEKAMGLHKIKVVAYDYAGNTAVDEQRIWIFNL